MLPVFIFSGMHQESHLEGHRNQRVTHNLKIIHVLQGSVGLRPEFPSLAAEAD